MHKIRSAFAVLALAGIALDSMAAAQAPQDQVAGDIVVNMRGVEIADVADQISRLTGRTLILDPAVKGVVTVSSPILDSTRRPIMAVSAVGFATQFSASSLQALCEDLRERCKEATAAISGGAVTSLW